MYRLAAMDMDGTLLTDDKYLQKETLQAIEEADLAGKLIALCTGRPLSELKPYLPLLGHVRYGILESGGCIYDFREKKVLSRHTLPSTIIPEILSIMKLEEIMPQAIIEGKSFVSTVDLENMDHFQMGIYSSLYHEVASPVEDMFHLIEENASLISKLNLYHVSRQASMRTSQRLEHLPVVRTYAEHSSLELSPMGVDKGSGLKELAAYLGIPMDQTIAVGDADNDIPSLKEAGLGVAMKNAKTDVLACADVITDDNEHDGCGKIIRQYLLG